MNEKIEHLIEIYKNMLPIYDSMESEAFKNKKDTLKMVIIDLERILEEEE